MAKFWAVRDHLRAFTANDNSTKAVEFKNFLDNPEMIRGVACRCVCGEGGGVTPPTFTELVGKTRSRSVMAEAVGKIDRLN